MNNTTSSSQRSQTRWSSWDVLGNTVAVRSCKVGCWALGHRLGWLGAFWAEPTQRKRDQPDGCSSVHPTKHRRQLNRINLHNYPSSFPTNWDRFERMASLGCEFFDYRDWFVLLFCCVYNKNVSARTNLGDIFVAIMLQTKASVKFGETGDRLCNSHLDSTWYRALG